jgi:hypothetical protein
MDLFPLAAKAILITFCLVVTVLSMAALVVIFARLDVDLLDVLYVMAALITISGAFISLLRWMSRRR